MRLESGEEACTTAARQQARKSPNAGTGEGGRREGEVATWTPCIARHEQLIDTSLSIPRLAVSPIIFRRAGTSIRAHKFYLQEGRGCTPPFGVDTTGGGYY
jgi:hypothetical protein